jgi:hypothetical protein
MPNPFSYGLLSTITIGVLSMLPSAAAAAPQLNCAEAQKEIDSGTASQNWDDVYNSFKRFADCDDRDNKIADGHGASIERLLVEHWNELTSLSGLVRADSTFERYVFRHLADLRQDPLKTIVRNANEACPSGQQPLCRRLEYRANEILVERRGPSGEELNAPECNLSQVDRWVGDIALQRGTKDAIDTALPCLLTLWRDDRGGSTKFVVSDAYLSLMEQNPAEFFLMMTKEPKIFAEWVDDLDNLSFTWPHEPPCQLEATRKHLISILQQSETAPGKPSSLKEAVISKLSETRCRQIQ